MFLPGPDPGHARTEDRGAVIATLIEGLTE
jgi:hypothetical protein